MGNPPDEMDPSANDWLNRYICRPPSIEVTILHPEGRVFVNDNPSGDQEWERFSITEDPLMVAPVEPSTVQLAAGLAVFADFLPGRLPGREGLADCRFAGCGGAASAVL